MTSIADSDFRQLSVIIGYLADDGWIPPLLSMKIVPSRVADSLKLRFWNPDADARFSDNTVYVAYGDASTTCSGIRAGEVVEIELIHPSLADQPELLTVTSDAYLLPDAADRRTRGILLLELSLSDDGGYVEEFAAVAADHDGSAD